MRRFLMLSAIAASSACVPPRPPQRIAGTYAVWLCADVCAARDTAVAPVAGYLVLSDTALALGAFSERMIDRSMFFRGTDDIPNACFSLEQRGKGSGLMAGIIPAAITHWTTTGDTLRVRLYASPDAGYTLRALVKNGRLLGAGRESGFIGGFFDESKGRAHGVRLGDADVARCTSGPP